MSDKFKASLNTTSDSVDVETLTNMDNELPIHANALKGKFSAGAVPLEGDFTTLIETIYTALAAVGLDPDSTATGKGLQVNDNKKLEVKVTVDASGLTVGDNGVAVDTTTIQPKLTQGEGITLNGASIAVDTDTVQQKISTLDSYGLEFYNDGKSLRVKALPFGDSNGFDHQNAVGPAYTTISSLHLYVPISQFQLAYTSNSHNTMSIKPGLLNVDGMIQMFSGKEVPEGWALCDGECSKITGRKRPDLSSMFINESKSGEGDGLVYVINESGYSDALVRNPKINDGESD